MTTDSTNGSVAAHGHRALVTGAARGIGLATCAKLIANGWQVIAVDNDAETLLSATDGINGLKPEVCDVSDSDAVDALSQRCMRDSDVLHALINNAGIADFGPLQETSYETWRSIMSTNLDGPFLMTQAFTKALARARGAVVNVTSISGLRASTLRVAYGTSKAALAHLTTQQAVELSELGIRVNAVAPGPVDTAMAKKVHTAAIRSAYHEAIPLNRYGLENELADAIAYLCSDQASYITGQQLAVDGGFSAAGVGLPALRQQK